MRRLPPPFPSPTPSVVRPIERLFPFEVNVRSTSSNNTPSAASPSHHVPVMGFGGALISQNRQNAADEQAARQRREQEREQQRVSDVNLGRRFTNFYRSAIRHFSRSHVDDDPLTHILAENGQDLFFPSFVSPPRRESPEYNPLFTHPAKPASGYTFHFTSPSPPSTSASTPTIHIDDSAVASTSAARSDDASTLLVCARCLDPLVLGDNGPRRLWGLRCGHLIDGKCVEQINKPPVNNKGKGKATEKVAHDMGEADAWSGWKAEPVTKPDTNSIMARLRPRHPHRSSQLSDALPSFFHPYRQSVRHKGKSKMDEPPVEARHEWVCPVDGCGKVHLSLFVGGKWIMDKEKGAIGVYA